MPNLHHLFQTAEAIRKDGHPEWLQLVGFLHDFGKIMYIWGTEQEGISEKKQWMKNLKNRYIEAVPLDNYVANRAGSHNIRLTDNSATNWAPSWHPNGEYIVFSSNMDDWSSKDNTYGHNFELYVIHIKTKELQRLTYNDTFDSFPVFSKDGKKLVFSSNRNAENPRQTNIFIADVVGGLR